MIKKEVDVTEIRYIHSIWLRRMDLNQRPSGYEPDELPSCSTPRYKLMAEKEGFEPPRRRRPPGFQDRSLQPDLGISPITITIQNIHFASDI